MVRTARQLVSQVRSRLRRRERGGETGGGRSGEAERRSDESRSGRNGAGLTLKQTIIALGSVAVITELVTPLNRVPGKIWSSATGLISADPEVAGLIRTADEVSALDPAGGDSKPETEVVTFNSGMDSAGKKWKFYRSGGSGSHIYVIKNGKNEDLRLTGNESGGVTLEKRRDDDAYQRWRIEDGQLRNDRMDRCVLHTKQVKEKIRVDRVKLGPCGAAAGTRNHGSDQWHFPDGL